MCLNLQFHNGDESNNNRYFKIWFYGISVVIFEKNQINNFLFFFVLFQIVSKDSHSLVSAHYRLDSHPRVSSLHEVLVGNRYLYLVFPRAHGDLHSYVRSRKRLRETEARKLFKQIAETVQVCHRNGIVLRDLKLRKFVFADKQR